MDRVIRLVRTMAWLRWRLMLNSLRTVRGLSETVIRVLALLLGGTVTVLIAVGAGLGIFFSLVEVARGDARLVLEIAWTIVGFLALLIPVVVGEGRAELAPRRLLQFPVSRADLFWAGLAGSVLAGANLVWYPAMAATVLAAVASGRFSPLLVLAAGFLATASILAIQQGLLMGMQWLARSRRLREIVSLTVLFLVIAMAQIPNILGQANVHLASTAGAASSIAVRVALGLVRSLPPMLAAHVAAPAGVLDGLTGLVGTVLWTGLGLGLAWKLYLGSLERQPQAGASPGGRAGRRGALVPAPLELLAPDLGALAAKQLRYIFRSALGRLTLLMSPIIGLVFAFMGRNVPKSILGLGAHDALFLFLAVIGAMYGSDMVANRFQWDAGGAALYFVTPVDPGRILLGLDIGVGLYQALASAVVLLVFCLVTGLPRPATLAAGLLLFVAARTVYSSAGTVFSILFPTPRDMGASRARLTLVPALAMTATMSLSVAGLGIPAVLILAGGYPAMALLFLLVAACAAILLQTRLVLPGLGRLLAGRREVLLHALESRPE